MSSISETRVWSRKEVRPKHGEADCTMVVEKGRLKGYFETNRTLETYPTQLMCKLVSN